MFEHVVIGVEFSPGGEAVLRSLPALKSLGTVRLTLVTVVDAVHSLNASVEYLDALQVRLDAARAPLEAEGFEVTTQVAFGDPASEICAAADAAGASLVLVGSRSHSLVVDSFIGSTAWEVVQRSSLPVFVQRVERVSGGATEPSPLEAVSAIDYVIFPTDWSATAGRAFTYVETLARLGRIPSFLLLHVRSQLEETHTGKSTEAADLARLRELSERLRAAGAVDVQVEAPTGAPFIEIVRRAERHPGTLIVMGTHGRGIIGDAFLGSVSREVVRKTLAPVLLAPANRKDVRPFGTENSSSHQRSHARPADPAA